MLAESREPLASTEPAFDPNRRLALADCCASLAALHADLAAGHEPGAVPWAFPDLAERHRKAEDCLDALAKTPGGPTEADWRAGLEELRAVWLEARGRFGAQARATRRTDKTAKSPAGGRPDAGATRRHHGGRGLQLRRWYTGHMGAEPMTDTFPTAVAKRLDVGAVAYGDRSFQQPPGELTDEIEQELLDVCAWSYILWCRVRALRGAVEQRR
ncbi:MAG: hypothetical protein HY699_16185 [Deltaproteobacteria bacterium]|nr:hypothetical protein [Deltaproteobacteria bacterium]